MSKLKTSREWQEEYKDDITVIDPDGWDRKNYDYSWNEEIITEHEFMKRVYISTCKFSRNFGVYGIRKSVWEEKGYGKKDGMVKK